MVKRYLCLPRNSSVTAQIKGLWHADLEAVIFGVGEIEIAIIALILEETEHPPRGRQGITVREVSRFCGATLSERRQSCRN